MTNKKLKLAAMSVALTAYPCDKWLCTPAWENSNTKEKLTLKRLRLFRMPASIRSSIMEISIV